MGQAMKTATLTACRQAGPAACRGRFARQREAAASAAASCTPAGGAAADSEDFSTCGVALLDRSDAIEHGPGEGKARRPDPGGRQAPAPGRGETSAHGPASVFDDRPFETIELADRPRFDLLFARVQPQISDLTFTNLFMWRRLISMRAAWTGGFAVIRANPRRYPPYAYAPVGDMSDTCGFTRAVALACESFEAAGETPRFRCVPSDVLPHLESALRASGISPRCEPDRDFFDYAYSAESLISLRGKKLDGKRNHINRFLREREYEWATLGPEHADDCARLMQQRCEDVGCACLQGDYEACDRMPSLELLAHLGELGCRGGVVYVDGRLEAFTVGEALNDDTAVIYIEKANPSINGLYAFINQGFCEREWSRMAFINREEDEGIEGLRKAKLSYQPARLVEKHTVYC